VASVIAFYASDEILYAGMPGCRDAESFGALAILANGWQFSMDVATKQISYMLCVGINNKFWLNT